MCRNYTGIRFTHFIIDNSDGTIFACARENGHTYNFLIREGAVRAQNGDQWFELAGEYASAIRERAEYAYTSVPSYRVSRLLLN